MPVRIEESANVLAPRNSNGEDRLPRTFSQETGSHLPDAGQHPYILRALDFTPETSLGCMCLCSDIMLQRDNSVSLGTPGSQTNVLGPDLLETTPRRETALHPTSSLKREVIKCKGNLQYTFARGTRPWGHLLPRHHLVSWRWKPSSKCGVNTWGKDHVPPCEVWEVCVECDHHPPTKCYMKDASSNICLEV